MAQGTQQPIHQNGSNNNHPLGEIKSLFDSERKVWMEKKSWSVKNCFPRIFKKIKNEIGDFESPQAEETDEDLRRIVTESKLPGHKIHGFENEIEALRNFLLKKEGEDEFRALAVVGQPGIGKTALCQMIFNDEDVKKRFVPRIWVSMFGEIRENEDPKIAIVKRILENLGVDEEIFEYIQKKAEEDGEEGIENRVLSRLLYVLHLQLWGKKFLIVLDDVCRSDGWEEKLDEKNPNGENQWGTHVSCGFPKFSGGRVIFSSRNRGIAEKLVGEDDLHLMYPITDQESCWSIYWDAVEENSKIETDERFKKNYEDFVKKIEGGDVKNLNKCKEELMNKTGGVPLAARLLMRVIPEEYVPPVKLNDDNQTDTNGTGIGQNNTDQNNTQPDGTEQNQTEQSDTEGSDGDQTDAEENNGDLTGSNQTDSDDDTVGTITEHGNTAEANTEQNNNDGDRTDSGETETDSGTDGGSTEPRSPNQNHTEPQQRR